MTEASTQPKPTNPSASSGQAPGQVRPGSSPAFLTDAEKKAQADKAKAVGNSITDKDEPQGRYNSSTS